MIPVAKQCPVCLYAAYMLAGWYLFENFVGWGVAVTDLEIFEKGERTKGNV